MRAFDPSKRRSAPRVAAEPEDVRSHHADVAAADLVWWGEELINLYNDAYKSIIGGKHPRRWAGRPRSCGAKSGRYRPALGTAMRGNEGTYVEALLLIMERHGYPEETYYTFSYSPVPERRGGTGGIICANTDDTQRIIGERRLAILRELAARTVSMRVLARGLRAAARARRTGPAFRAHLPG